MNSFLSLTIIMVFINSALYGISFFSSAQQGIGLHEYTTTARGYGMGGTGLALPDNKSLNPFNPSTWRHIDNTRFSILLGYDINNISFSKQKITSNSGNFNGIQLAIPIKKHEWILGFSLTPYTVVNFNYNLSVQSSQITYQETTFFEGSISRAQFNLGWAPTKKIGVNAGFNYFFGGIEDQTLTSFSEPAYSNSFSIVKYRFNGPGFGFSSDFNPTDSLYIGGFIDFKPSLKLTIEELSPSNFVEEEAKEKSTLPLLWGIGSSLHFARQWNISADFVFQNWSEGFNIDGAKTDQLEDWYRVGFGVEHSHSKKRTSAFLNKIDIRAGFSAGNIGYKFNNNRVDEYKAHFGLGIPFFGDRGRFDIAFIAGIRGDRSQTVAEEKFFRFLISVSAGELWFQKLR